MVEQLKASDVDNKFPYAYYCVVASPRRSGKSHFTQWLVREGFREGRFAAIWAISPTAHLQDGMFDFVPKKRLLKPGNKVNFEGILNRIIAFQTERKKEGNRQEVLLIFDDCHPSSRRGVARASGAMERLSANGRHHGIACLVLTQRLGSVSKSCRINSDVLCTFFCRDETTRRIVIEEWLSRENTINRKTTRDIATKVLADVFNDDPYRVLVVFPNDPSRTLDNICRWARADETPSTKPVVLKHVQKPVDTSLHLTLTGINFLQ